MPADPLPDPPARFETAPSPRLGTSAAELFAAPPAPYRSSGPSLPQGVEPTGPLDGRVPSAGFPVDEEDIRLAVSLGARPDLSLPGAGRLLAQNFANRLVDPQEILEENLRERPLATGVALAGAVGAYVGWERLNDGRLSGSYTFGVGEARLSLSGWYDLQTGDWAGRARVDLSRVLDEL